MAVPPVSVSRDSDPERTAELPVLDPAAYRPEPDESPTERTDTWAAPVPLRPEGAESPAAQALETRLRETQARLAAKNERLAQVERAREHAQSNRAAAEQRAAQLHRELAEMRASHDFQVDELARARAQFEEELARARALVSAAGARADSLEKRIEEHESSARTQQVSELERERAAQRERAQSADVVSDLHLERARALSYLERLQSAESLRLMLEGLVTELHHESGERDGDRARLARLEAELASLTGRLAQRDAQLRESRRETEKLERSVAALRSELAASAQAAELEAALGELRTRHAQLEDELAAARKELRDSVRALESARQEAASRARELERRAAEHLEPVRSLQAEAEANAARARELEGDLHAAEDTVHRLEAEARGRNARAEEPGKAARPRPKAADEVRHAATDTAAASGVLWEAARGLEGGARAGPDPVPDGGLRLLVRSEDGREIVHLLGRKTRIGRTPDNDLQIDANYVSRHHAVVLAGPVHTIIEDLSSTNGVQVNGRRVIRHALKDGDAVLIGRAQFRFVVRRGAEKR